MNEVVKQFEDLKYIERDTGKEKSPVIILLHGAGSRGDDIDVLMRNPGTVKTAKYEDFILFAPQCNKDTWFDHFETLQRFVKYIASLSYVDSERIYLMGPSMGGYGTWQLAMSMPEMFAAIVPICGGGMYWNTPRLKNLPVWAFHGALDGCVLPEESKKMVDAVNRNGGNAKLTIYPDRDHNSWDPTYENPEVFAWLLEHKNSNMTVNTQKLDSVIYG